MELFSSASLTPETKLHNSSSRFDTPETLGDDNLHHHMHKPLKGFEVVATVPCTESTPALLNSRLPSAVDGYTRNTVATKTNARVTLAKRRVIDCDLFSFRRLWYVSKQYVCSDYLSTDQNIEQQH